jgi:hypothetical protein
MRRLASRSTTKLSQRLLPLAANWDFRPIAARQASPKLSDAHRGILEFRFHEAAARDPRGHEYNMTTTGANGLRVYAMPHDRMLEAMRKHGRLP